MNILLVILILPLIFTPLVQARTTPADIVNSQKDAYNQTVKNYTDSDKQKLEKLSLEIASINKTRTNELQTIMQRQGDILDEYQNRLGNIENLSITKARYWITYAHEAVAYQAAKIYIFNLTSEQNIKGDSNNLISLFESDLNSARLKVINSQKILEDTVK